ncbi:hypothetical protein JR316_0000627 [Psilocybe cubensis]|uniref:Uncharacterized protein n=2 Tax=Psilocybe cubensis TaxID=181762 RepID=A0A8H7YAB4_PSICU|nr:hypothetical protein JR316_0000627 [Psilocybe cubensis]KAH9486562.1 hypothetical protein JR316_0000627 [Psilocybe cubensis]
MATRRRIGVSAATTEAARRQLMQPVPCWEKVWITPSGMAAGSSSLKVFKWVKTEKAQQFSDDEGEVDEPLAPLPDEPEVNEGDEDLEQEEPRVDAVPAKDVDMETNQDDPPSKVPSPKPQLMMQSGVDDEPQDPTDGLDSTLKPLEIPMDDEDENGNQTGVEGLELDISNLGPDGLQLEGSHDLSQLDGPDGLIGGSLMDDSIDPFTDTT